MDRDITEHKENSKSLLCNSRSNSKSGMDETGEVGYRLQKAHMCPIKTLKFTGRSFQVVSIRENIP